MHIVPDTGPSAACSGVLSVIEDRPPAADAVRPRSVQSIGPT